MMMQYIKYGVSSLKAALSVCKAVFGAMIRESNVYGDRDDSSGKCEA